jgi:hypothetical protein
VADLAFLSALPRVLERNGKAKAHQNNHAELVATASTHKRVRWQNVRSRGQAEEAHRQTPLNLVENDLERLWGCDSVGGLFSAYGTWFGGPQ